MIDHYVNIGGRDVSNHVISISTQQSIEDDSNPGKIKVILANPDGIYTRAFVPQLHKMEITLYNFMYSSKRPFAIAQGHLTDAVSDPSTGEITLTGEDELGHLSDYLPRKFEFNGEKCSKVLTTVLGTHVPVIKFSYFCKNDPSIGETTFDESMDYQSVLEKIRDVTGANFYFDESGWLRYRDANAHVAYMDLDPFVSNPCEAKSIMGFCNTVQLTCYRPVDANSDQDTSPDHAPLIGTATDESSDYAVQKIYKIQAPLRYAYNVVDQDTANAAALDVLNWYNSKMDSLTEVVVEGIAPQLQSLVKYTAFVPVDATGNDAIEIPIYGMVLERNIEYSADGFECTIKIHPTLDSENLQSEIANLEAMQNDDTNAHPLGSVLSKILDALGLGPNNFLLDTEQIRQEKAMVKALLDRGVVLNELGATLNGQQIMQEDQAYTDNVVPIIQDAADEVMRGN
jgi:hypothetical protein